MDGDHNGSGSWMAALAILVVATIFLVVDPGGMADRFAHAEFAAFRALDRVAAPLRTVNSLPAELVLLLTVGGALALLVSLRQPSWTLGVAFAAALVAQAASWLFYVHLHVLFDTANASLALVLAAGGGILSGPLRSPSRIRRMPSRLRPPPRRPPSAASAETDDTPTGGSEIWTSLACSLRLLPLLAQHFGGDRSAFLRLVQSTLSSLMDEAWAQGAWISRYDGQSFAAHWRAADSAAHADHACEAVDRMLASLTRANEGLARQWPPGETPCPLLDIGIGVSTGRFLVGATRTRGGLANFVMAEQCTPPEDLAPLAARYGVAALVAEQSCADVQRAYAFLEVDFLALRENQPPVRLYALLGNALIRANPKFRALATFHDHIFRAIRARQWEKARELIEQCRKLSAASPKVYDLHLSRIAWYEANPPPPDWDGAFRPPLV